MSEGFLDDPRMLRLALGAYIRRTAGLGVHVVITDAEIQQIRDFDLRGNLIGEGLGKTLELWVDPPETVAVLADRRRSQ